MAEFSIMSSALASEKPFSFKDTPGKLPKDVVPTDYSVRIVPDIDKLTFAGTETVKLNVRRHVRQLVLNALELKIEAASIDGKELPRSAIKTDTKNELLTLALPSELATGEHTLALRFTGKINQQGRAFSTCGIRSKAPVPGRSCSEANLKRPMPVDFFLAGTSRSFARASN